MLIGFSMPAVNAVALSAGATWLTADAGTALFDGKPARAARINRSAPVTITVTLAKPMVVGVIALLGLNVPAGTAISAAGASGVAHALPDGTVCAYLLPTGTDAVSSVAVVVGGTGLLHIGELVIMRVTETRITHDWGVQRVDAKVSERTRGSQAVTTPGISYRRLRTMLSMASDAAVRAGGLSGSADWDTLDAALVNDQRCIVIPRRKIAGVFDATLLHRTAIYGVASEIGETTHLQGPWYSKSLVFEEVPALPL